MKKVKMKNNMTTEEAIEMFETNENDQYLKFHLVTNRASERSDLNAFILLDKLKPGITDIVRGANHDKIYLGYVGDWAPYLEGHHVITLLRCGVMCSDDYLYMNI